MNGRQVRCTVVHFGTGDSTVNESRFGIQEETTVWIDPRTLGVLKEERRGSNKVWFGVHPTPFAPTHYSETITTFSTVDFGGKPAADTFTFEPSKGDTEVAKLPTPFPENAGGSAHTQLSNNEQAAEEHLGKPLPDVMVQDMQGAEVPLRRFLGRPLLIDIWATWCLPCDGEFPALNAIRDSTAKTDLQMIAVDENSKPEDAAALLKRRVYDWNDFHDTSGLGKMLSAGEIPVLVLTDAAGKIVYFHVGADDAKGLAAAIAKLGPAYASVKAD